MKMKQNVTGITLNITEHIILKNWWEYYITDRKDLPEGIREALVLGFEDEIGDVSLEEIRPYIQSRTSDLTEVMPAPGWRWV